MSAPTTFTGTDALDLPTAAGRDRRTTTLLLVGLALAVLATVVIGSLLVGQLADQTHLRDRNQPPSLDHWFGTDRYGRDLFARVLIGLRLSLLVGTSAAVISGTIALALACVAAVGGPRAEAAVNWLVDLFLALPHLVMLILISFALGGGTEAVVIGIAVTHWPSLTRVLLATARTTMSSDAVAISRALGHGRGYLARRHVLGALITQFTVGTVLLFPHAILHETALSFLGLGIDPGQPAIGNLLESSMRSLSSGYWWLAALPGLGLLIVVKLIDNIADGLRSIFDPRSHHL